MTPSDSPASTPIARLFAIAFRSLIDDLHDELRTQGWADVRPAYGFVLLAARDEPTTATAVANLMGISKQAASKLLDTMESGGYLRRTDAEDGRQRPVQLTGRGRDLLAAVEQIYTTLEKEWANVIGVRALERLRADLVKVLSPPDGGELPPIRPTW